METERSSAKDLSGIGLNAAMNLADLSIAGLNAVMSLADPGILVGIPESSSVVLFWDRQSSTLLRCTLNRVRRCMS